MPHRGVLTQGNQRPKVAIAPGLQGLPLQHTPDLSNQKSRLLMRRLGAGRYQGPGGLADPGGCSTVAKREDPRIRDRLQMRIHHKLMDGVGLEPELREKFRRFHSRRPDHHLRRNLPTVNQTHASRHDFRHPCLEMDLHIKALQQGKRLGRKTLRQRWKNAIGGLDKMNTDVFVRIDVVKAEGHKRAGGIVQLGG